ncbi:MAG: peptidylprolyl isomerase, partial [Bacillota bacterium]
MPRSSIARGVLLVALTALPVVAVTGCFRVEQEIDLTGWPTAGVSLTLWVDKAFAGAEMDLLLDSLHLVVPGAGDAPEPVRHDEAVGSRTWTVFEWAPVEIQPGEALPFTMARQDGDRYSFTWEIGPYQGLSGQIPDDAILLSVRITFAGEVESANAAHVEGRRARWDIRKADIARGVALQATTRTQAVARVNDELIGAAAFQRAFRAQLRAYQQVQGFVRPTQMEELRYGVLNDLIAMRLIVQAARQEGILVDPQEVDAQLDEIIDAFPSRAEFERQLGLQDLTERELRVAIEENLIAQKLTETLVSRIPVTDEEVARAFEQVRARHVLVRPEQMDVEQSWNEALQRAEGIRRRVEAGADFAELARAESDDEFSRDEGGELGFFGRGETPEPVERAAFTMAVGAVSQPIRSDFGYHIIQVLEKKEATGPEFEAARPGLVERIRRSKADEVLEQWFSRVQSTAATSILDLQLAARDARSRG